jgi:hypothetical protein
VEKEYCHWAGFSLILPLQRKTMLDGYDNFPFPIDATNLSVTHISVVRISVLIPILPYGITPATCKNGYRIKANDANENGEKTLYCET